MKRLGSLVSLFERRGSVYDESKVGVVLAGTMLSSSLVVSKFFRGRGGEGDVVREREK